MFRYFKLMQSVAASTLSLATVLTSMLPGLLKALQYRGYALTFANALGG